MGWYPAVVSEEAAVEPLSLDAAKRQCKVDGADSDGDLTDYIAAARANVEAMTGTRLITQTLDLYCDGFDDLSRLPVAPVQSITEITYVDGDGATQTLDPAIYEARLFGLSPKILLAYGRAWPTTREGSLVTVTAVVGYGDAGEDVPQDVAHALKLLVSQWFDNRAPINVGNIVNDLPNTVPALLANHRIYSF